MKLQKKVKMNRVDASLTDAELDARLGELLKQHPDEHQVFYYDKLVESLGGENSGVSVSKNAVKKRIVALRKAGDSPMAVKVENLEVLPLRHTSNGEKGEKADITIIEFMNELNASGMSAADIVPPLPQSTDFKMVARPFEELCRSDALAPRAKAFLNRHCGRIKYAVGRVYPRSRSVYFDVQATVEIMEALPKIAKGRRSFTFNNKEKNRMKKHMDSCRLVPFEAWRIFGSDVRL